jgi:hypothetical protein
MNERILKLINTIYNIDECKSKEFTLTLNYNKEIQKKGKYKTHNNNGHEYLEHIGWDVPVLNEEGLKQIATAISEVDDITSFNFTLIFEHGVYHGSDYRYDDDWYDCKIIFYGDKDKIFIHFDMLSTFCGMGRDTFYRYLCPPTVEDEDDDEREENPILNENKIQETVLKLLELKTTLTENGSRTINKLKEISVLTKNN